MATSKKPGTPGQRKHVQRWTYNPVQCGSQHRGFIAGQPFGVFIHRVAGVSKPCRESMTDKALPCDHCAKGLVPDWRGYTPYYDESYTPNFCMITFPYYESVCELPHLSQIIIRRGKKQTDCVVIRGETWRTTPIPHTRERAEPIDLGNFLVHVLFKDQELITWDLKQQVAEKEATPKPYTAPEYVDKDIQRLRLMALKEQKAAEENARAGDLALQIIRDATTPKPNGKHKAAKTE